MDSKPLVPKESQPQVDVDHGAKAAELLEKIGHHQYAVRILFTPSVNKLKLVSKEDEKLIKQDVTDALSLAAEIKAVDKATARNLKQNGNKLIAIMRAYKYLAKQTKSLSEFYQAASVCGWEELEGESWRSAFVAKVANVSYPVAVEALKQAGPDMKKAIELAPNVKLKPLLGTPPKKPSKKRG